MSLGHSPIYWAGFVAESPVSLNANARNGAHVTHALRKRAEHQDTRENRLRQRDRRIGLALMAGSCLISALSLYGVWTLLRVAL
jgi:hypothetical protein